MRGGKKFISIFVRLLFNKKNELGGAADKLRNGLSKIDDTRQKVEKMSIELEDAKTKVAQFQKQCDEYLVIIVQQKREADEQQKVGRSLRRVKYACTVKPVYHMH